jgi:hypothetical protein
MKLAAGEMLKTHSGYRYGTQGGRDIITVHCFPPIPVRRDYDWCAYHDGDDEKPHMHGWGETEIKALADLRRLDREAYEIAHPEEEEHEPF